MNLVWWMLLLLAIVQIAFLPANCISLGNTSFPERMNKWPQDNACPSNRCQQLELREMSSCRHRAVGSGFLLSSVKPPVTQQCQPLEWSISALTDYREGRAAGGERSRLEHLAHQCLPVCGVRLLREMSSEAERPCPPPPPLKERKVVISLTSGFKGLLGPADLEQGFLMFIKRSLTVLKRNMCAHKRIRELQS